MERKEPLHTRTSNERPDPRQQSLDSPGGQQWQALSSRSGFDLLLRHQGQLKHGPVSASYISAFRARTRSSAVTEAIGSRIVQVVNVGATDMLKYSFPNQNPPSFTCERMSDPAPTATTRSSRSTAGLVFSICAINE